MSRIFNFLGHMQFVLKIIQFWPFYLINFAKFQKQTILNTFGKGLILHNELFFQLVFCIKQI